MKNRENGTRVSTLLLLGFTFSGQAGCRTPSTEANQRAATTGTETAGKNTSAMAEQVDHSSLHSFRMRRLDGTDAALSTYAGKVLLIVNTASQCGYTPQYEGLQALHARYEASGFSVLGFPSNDFGGQEPGSSEEIATFCKTRFGVNFPMFEKVKTKGSDAAPLYVLLAEAKGAPKWNFHKYLVDKHGVPVRAWPSTVAPDSPEISGAIDAELARQ